MKLLITALIFAAAAFAQDAPANPLISVSKTVYGITKSNISRSLDKIPDDLWSYQPTKDIRTFGQLFAHIADAQYEFCGVPSEGKMVNKDLEKTLKTKAEVSAALKEAFAYCDAAYAKMTDANAAEIVPFFGMKATKLGIMDFNSAHNMEHYGNLVTYMRLKGIVPPSSEARPAAAPSSSQKK
jgi:uncharacterized damage-inducible protein DinB